MYLGGARKEGPVFSNNNRLPTSRIKVSAATSPLLTTSPLISPLFSPLLSFDTLLGIVDECAEEGGENHIIINHLQPVQTLSLPNHSTTSPYPTAVVPETQHKHSFPAHP